MARRQIVGIAGKKRSGKDTLCSMMQAYHPYQQVAFAGALWSILLAADPWIDMWTEFPTPHNEYYRLTELNDRFGYEYCKEHFPEVRRLMQDLGTQGVREHIGPTTWLDIVIRKIKASPTTSFIVTDVRFDNEAQAIQELGGIVVKLERDSNNTDMHVSENIESIKQDVLYRNNSGLDDLDRFAEQLIRRY